MPLRTTTGLYGQRLVPHVIDEIARTDPDQVCYIIPVSDESYRHGKRTITYAIMAQAVDRAAWFLKRELGPNTTAGETLAYLGPNDLRYFILTIAAIKAGYKLLLPSPRNSAGDQLHLLEATKCRTFLKSKSTRIDHVVSIFKAGTLRVTDVPEVDDLVAVREEDRAPFPYTMTYDEACDQPAVVLHSSGSTGQVNPIIQKHSSWASVDRHHLLPRDTGMVSALQALPPGTPILLAMPYFHAAGLMSGLIMNVFYGCPGILLPSARPISTPLILETMEYTKPGIAVLAPSTLEEVIMSPKGAELLSQCLQVQYGGGALAPHASEEVSKYTQLQSVLGTTEAGVLPTYVLEDGLQDHEYLRFNPNQPGIEFRQQDSGLFEIVLVRHSGPSFFFIFETFPHLQEYRTKDLFQPHPSKPGLWKHVGRTDDVIVLSNAEKVVPSILQNHLQRAPLVKDAIIVGQNRPAVAAIIELSEDSESADLIQIRTDLEPYIEIANRDVPSHSKLSSDMIIFTSKKKPMTRVGKGTVSRHATIGSYETELEALYRGDESNVPVREDPLVNGVSEAATAQGLLELFSTVTSYSDLTPTQDFLSVGIDSLQIFTLVRHLRAQLQAEKASVPLEAIRATLLYTNPTVTQLSQALHELASNGSNVPSKGLTLEQRAKRMQEILQKHTTPLLTPSPRIGQALSTGVQKQAEAAILTGSTGSLGSYLLHTLLTKSCYRRIFCLNRSADAQEKQIEAFKARELSTQGWDGRVEFLHADMGRPRFGLKEADYSRIESSASLILHTQWAVNFNLPLSSFEPHIQGVKSLIDLAASAPLRPTLLFTSSIAATQNWGTLNPTRPVPETVVADPAVAVGSGYGESKWIAECLLDAGVKTCKVDARVVRLGQLAGSVDSTSVWNRHEWFPSLVFSSKYLGAIPSSIGAIHGADFVPVDQAARILIELGGKDGVRLPNGTTADTDAQSSNSDSNSNVDVPLFNLVNPNPVLLSSVLATVASSLRPPLKVVTYQEWLSALRKTSKQALVDTSANPAIKLLDFFEQMGETGDREADESTNPTAATTRSSRYDTAHTKEHSAEMRRLEAWRESSVQHWLRGWGLLE